MKAFTRSAAALAALVMFAALAAPASADEAKDPPLLALGAGWYDLSGDDSAGDFRLEYRHGPAWFGFLKPFAGLEVTTDGGVWGQVPVSTPMVTGVILAMRWNSARRSRSPT